MAPVMKNQQRHISSTEDPGTDEQSWQQLYDRIRQLTLKRSASMLSEPSDDDDLFDRGARSLRALMGAAQVARQMTQEDKKEKRRDDEKTTRPVISDAQANKAYRSARRAVERAEKSLGETASDQGCPDALASGAGGKTMEDQRS